MKKSNTGFTLLELLLAVSIFAIVATVLYSTFYTGTRILRRAESAMEFHQRLRIATEEMALDLRNALPVEIDGAAFPGIIEEEGGDDEAPVYYFTGEAKKFTFVTVKSTRSKEGMIREVCNVTYLLEGKGGALKRSVKRQGKPLAQDAGQDEILLTGITDMDVKYSYVGDTDDSPPIWESAWELEKAVPLGVKIALKMKGAPGSDEFTKTVYLPVGVLGEYDMEEGRP